MIYCQSSVMIEISRLESVCSSVVLHDLPICILCAF
jgi:hypothetical protein